MTYRHRVPYMYNFQNKGFIYHTKKKKQKKISKYTVIKKIPYFKKYELIKDMN